MENIFIEKKRNVQVRTRWWDAVVLNVGAEEAATAVRVAEVGQQIQDLYQLRQRLEAHATDVH